MDGRKAALAIAGILTAINGMASIVIGALWVTADAYGTAPLGLVAEDSTDRIVAGVIAGLGLVLLVAGIGTIRAKRWAIATTGVIAGIAVAGGAMQLSTAGSNGSSMTGPLASLGVSLLILMLLTGARLGKRA